MFSQTAHEKKIINGTLPGTYANGVSKAIARLSGKDVPGILKMDGSKVSFSSQAGIFEYGINRDKEELISIPKNPGFNSSEVSRRRIARVKT